MEHRIIFATSNEGKMREVREILKGLKAEVLSMKEAGVSVDIVEDGDTFEANAKIKARAVWEKTGGIVLADDSGLAVDYLNGEPGVYSARYMGEETSYEIKNWNLIHRLKGVEREKRTARFVCVIAAALPDGMHQVEVIADTGDCWMGFEPDGKKQQRTLRKGDTFSMTFRDSLVIRLGNARAVRIIYDGRELERSTSPRVVTMNFPSDVR